MNKMLLAATIIAGGLVLLAAGSQSESSDGPPASSPGIPTSWPATEPLGPNPPRAPGTPYDVGPAEAIWHYEELTTAEKDVVDRGRDTSAWDGPNAIYQQAAEQAEEQALAQLASFYLGIDGIGPIGVVP